MCNAPRKADSIVEIEFPDETFNLTIAGRLSDNNGSDLPLLPNRRDRLQEEAKPFERDICTVGYQELIVRPSDTLQGVKIVGIYSIWNDAKAINGDDEFTTDIPSRAF